MPLPIISARECVAALQRGGFAVRRQTGSHIIMSVGDTTVVVPNHKELGRGVEHDLNLGL